MSVPDEWKGMFPRILYTSNPGGVGHHYFKSNFVDQVKRGVWMAPEDEGSMLRTYVSARLSDNKILLLNDPQYAQRVKGMGSSQLVQAMLEGDWESLSTGGFADLWSTKTHVVVPFNIPHTWNISRGYDYGSSAPAAALLFAEADGEEFMDANNNLCWVPKGTIFIIAELYIANHKYEGLKLPATEQGRRIEEMENENGYKGRVEPGPADNSIFTSEPGKTSIADDMAIHVKYIRSDKTAGSRVIGVGLMRQRLQASLERPMERPGIYIFASCSNVVRTIPNLENDPIKVEDIVTTGEDHFWDVIRYKLLQTKRVAATIEVTGA